MIVDHYYREVKDPVSSPFLSRGIGFLSFVQQSQKNLILNIQNVK